MSTWFVPASRSPPAVASSSAPVSSSVVATGSGAGAVSVVSSASAVPPVHADVPTTSAPAARASANVRARVRGRRVGVVFTVVLQRVGPTAARSVVAARGALHAPYLERNGTRGGRNLADGR